MQILPFRGGALVCFIASLLFVASFCNADAKTVEVVGAGECADCAENNLEISQAFSGLRVSIDCKPENGKNFKTRGSGELDKQGNFKVFVPEDLVENGELKEECYAQLHSVSAAPCPAHDGLESAKLVLKSRSDGKHEFGLKGKLRFSPLTCASAFFWPHFKFPPLPKWNHPPLPKFPLPPFKGFHHHYPIIPPIYKKPLPPPSPVYKPPPVPVNPPVPIYKPPPVPVYKPPPVPVKPLPPPVPIYKPPPVEKPHPPPVPVYKPPPVPSINLLRFQYTRNRILLQFQSIRNHIHLQFQYTRNHVLPQFQSINLLQFRNHILRQFQSISLLQFRYTRNESLLRFQSTSPLQFLYTTNHYLPRFQCIRSHFHHLFQPTNQNPSLPFLTSHSLHFPRSLHSLRSHALPFLSYPLFPRFLPSISTTTLPFLSYLLSLRFLPSISTTIPSSENGLLCHPLLPIILKLSCIVLRI
uniref:Proline-rich protein n=1 Tax=Gossypium raimondii TaxID=29730 RepID=A0A0D2QFL0_GOSRA|nr:hypothetical protein B456_002G193500 [Gossypium raimondii]